MNKDTIQKIFENLQAANPHPKTDLDWTNNYTLLVAIILSAQSTDKGVNLATKALFEAVDTPEAMVELGFEGLKPYIKTIGLYNNKGKNIIAMSEALINEHNSEVPNTMGELVALAGVGRKTASVLLNVAFGEPTVAVDTHVFRISNRIGLAHGKTPEAIEKALLKIIPKEFGVYAPHWLVLHGRYTCKARKPLCAECHIYEFCEFDEKTV